MAAIFFGLNVLIWVTFLQFEVNNNQLIWAYSNDIFQHCYKGSCMAKQCQQVKRHSIIQYQSHFLVLEDVISKRCFVNELFKKEMARFDLMFIGSISIARLRLECRRTVYSCSTVGWSALAEHEWVITSVFYVSVINRPCVHRGSYEWISNCIPLLYEDVMKPLSTYHNRRPYCISLHFKMTSLIRIFRHISFRIVPILTAL